MNNQFESRSITAGKRAWIDSGERIVSFDQTANGVCYTATESDFWPHIMELVNIGYRLQ